MNLYKVSVKEYEEKFIKTIKQQDKEIKIRQINNFTHNLLIKNMLVITNYA